MARIFSTVSPLTAGQDVTLNAALANTLEGEVFVRYAALPDQTNFDVSSTGIDAGSRQLLIHAAQTGRYFPCSFTATTWAAQGVRLFADSDYSRGRRDIHQPQSRQQRRYSQRDFINGSGFTPGTTAVLSSSGATQTASSVRYFNSTTLSATFDLIGLTPGTYNLVTTTSGAASILAAAFTVNALPAGQLVYHVCLNSVTFDSRSAGQAR